MFRRLMAGRRAVAGSALAAAALITLATSAAHNSASAADPLEGSKVSSDDLRTLVSAAASCPTLTPARLAGQVMAASQFSSQPVAAMKEVGGQGPAALTTQVWDKWAPWQGAQPTDTEASIVALAHDMCQLVGQVRVVKIDGDQWDLALAAHRTSMEAVVTAGAVPDGAKEYVDTVERYAAWYALQPEFGGSGMASPTATTDPQVVEDPVVPVPDALVPAVVEAGKVCPEMPPSKIAAQVMATSGFDEQKLGATGEQGIAQFLPQTWVKYVPPSDSSTPWDPKTALPALGKTMCALVKDEGKYTTALATFTQGTAATETPVVTKLADVVDRDAAEYAKDTRLQVQASATSSTAASTSTSAAPGTSTSTLAEGKPATGATTPGKTTATTKPAKAPSETTSDQPPVKGPGSGASYGPYFLFDYGNGQCVDIPGYGVGPRDGPVNQAPCARTAPDNQRYAFVPRGKDGDGNQEYWIRSVTDNYCIDPPGVGAAGPEAQLDETGCFDQDNQYFRLQPTVKSGGRQFYWVVNTSSGLCLDVPGVKSTTPDTRLQLSSCFEGDDQDWALVKKW
jgi:hypothetical protein